MRNTHECTLKLIGIVYQGSVDKIVQSLRDHYYVPPRRTISSFVENIFSIEIDQLTDHELIPEVRQVIDDESMGFEWIWDSTRGMSAGTSFKLPGMTEVYSYRTIGGSIALPVYKFSPNEIARAQAAEAVRDYINRSHLHIVRSAHEYIQVAAKNPDLVSHA